MNLFTFPNFNQWSTPLLFLTLQGLIFAGLLFARYGKKRNTSDVLLAILLLILCYHRTTFIIGFMDWYDTFRNTKVNYYLIPMSFAVGPLLYLYVKSVTRSGFSLKREDVWHFVPQIIYTLYRIFIFGYDASQSGFTDTQNGVMMESVDAKYVQPFFVAFTSIQLLLYLAFTVQLFYQYRKKIYHFYSNTYKLELNWLRNFLAIYILLFIYEVMETMINISITDLHWTQQWWYHFVAALALIYIGIKGYFTDTTPLKDLEFNNLSNPLPFASQLDEKKNYDDQKNSIQSFLNENKSYLDPDLSLKSLSKDLKWTPGQLSEVINNGFGVNFNDYINSFRVEEVKRKIKSGEHLKLSLVAIAYDSGFNSKATFNRVFKKLTQMSPSEYAKSLK